MVSLKMVKFMDSLNISGQIICYMKDMATWTNSMLMEILQCQMEDIMMVNGIKINFMGMEFRNF